MTAVVTESGQLVRFLLARLDDDRRELTRMNRRPGGPTIEVADGGLGSPERLRVELVAKRRMIASLQQLVILHDLPLEKAVRDTALTVLQSLAMPYAGHREFRPQWHQSSR